MNQTYLGIFCVGRVLSTYSTSLFIIDLLRFLFLSDSVLVRSRNLCLSSRLSSVLACNYDVLYLCIVNCFLFYFRFSLSVIIWNLICLCFGTPAPSFSLLLVAESLSFFVFSFFPATRLARGTLPAIFQKMALNSSLCFLLAHRQWPVF